MDEQSIYKDIILKHARAPQWRGAQPQALLRQAGQNPLCGDNIVVYVDFDAAGKLCLHHEGYGCAITMASASIMASSLNGKSLAQGLELGVLVQEALQHGKLPEVWPAPWNEQEVELKALAAVRERPARIKCALLPWLATINALHHKDKPENLAPVSTES